MSSNLAYTLPDPRRRDLEEQPGRVRIVTTRAQRRARPKVAHALLALGIVFGIFMAQLLLSIALSGGAYRISSLQNTQQDLGRVTSSLDERLQTLASPQNLAANAQSLGMVNTSTPAYLRLSNGGVAGTPIPAAAAAPGSATTTAATDSVPNSLLAATAPIGSSSSAALAPGTPTPPLGGSKTNSASSATQSNGSDSNATDAAGSGSSEPGALPSPVTH
jgi:hypothetical protein